MCGRRPAAGPVRSRYEELGISKNIAGVNMRLNAGGIRELHWHKAAEWAYMLYGTVSQPSTLRDTTSSMTSASAISGISHHAFRIRSRVSIRMAASSSWSSTTMNLTKTIPSCSATGSSTRRTKCCPRISVFPAHPSLTFRIRASFIFSLPRCRDHSAPIGSPAGPKYHRVSATRCDQDQERNGADHRYQCVSGFEDDLVSAIAVAALIVAAAAMLRSRSPSIELRAGTAAMPPLQELHTMAGVYRLPVQDLDGQSLVYPTVAKR